MKYFKNQRHYVRLVSFCPKVPLHIFSDAKHKYNYVVLGWNTTSTSFFTLLRPFCYS